MANIKVKASVKSKCNDMPNVKSILQIEDQLAMNNQDSFIVCNDNNDFFSWGNGITAISLRKFSNFILERDYFQNTSNSVLCKFRRLPGCSGVMRTGPQKINPKSL